MTSAPESPEQRTRRRAVERHQREIGRRRRLALAGVGVLALVAGLVVGAGGEDDSDEVAEAEAEVEQLPRGGTSLLPRYRMVGFYGAPGDAELGTLGVGPPSEAAARLREQARAYRGDRAVLPVLELIAVTAAADPGEDGMHRIRQPHSVIRRYLEAARNSRALLLLDIQPGRADFADEVERLEPYLREPDVGLALDPEWHVGETEIPGQVIGSVDVATIDSISAELSETVRSLHLPEKLFVIHQFTAGMIGGKTDPVDRPGLATVINVDGFGEAPNKVHKYEQLHPDPASGLGSGFKLFLNEDIGLMSPDQVLDLEPKPDLIVYE
jgi:hypothetical protein